MARAKKGQLVEDDSLKHFSPHLGRQETQPFFLVGRKLFLLGVRGFREMHVLKAPKLGRLVESLDPLAVGYIFG